MSFISVSESFNISNPGSGRENDAERMLLLKESRILVIGAGRLGCHVLTSLAAAGPGTIGITDFRKVDPENIPGQKIFTAADIGKFKSDAVSERIHSANPGCRINIYNLRITPGNIIDIISDYDIVVDCSGNMPTHFLAGDATGLLDIPLVFGDVSGFCGQVSVFNYKGGPSWRSLFPEMIADDETGGYPGTDINADINGITGAFQSGEAVKIATGASGVLSSSVLHIDAFNGKTEIVEYPAPAGIQPSVIRDDYGFGSNVLSSVITPAELTAELKNRSKVTLYDVRPPGEFLNYNLGGINISAADLLDNPETIPCDGKVVILCESGDESLALTDYLQNNAGLSNVYSLEGGIRHWRETMSLT